MRTNNRRITLMHPLVVVVGIPVVMIVIAAAAFWSASDDTAKIVNDLPAADEPVNLNIETILPTGDPEPIGNDWYKRIGIGFDAEVKVNAFEFDQVTVVEAAFVNGTNASLWTLSPCTLPTVEWKKADGTYETFPAAEATCDAVPGCMEIPKKSKVKILDWDQTSVRINSDGEPVAGRVTGAYRIPFTVGIGCADGVLSDPQTHTSVDIILH